MSDNGKSYAMYKAFQQVESLKRQRDHLREALWEVVNDCSMSMSSGVEEFARAALKATEE